MLVVQVFLAVVVTSGTGFAKVKDYDAIVSCAKAGGQGRMYPDPDDCRKFIRCVSRKPVAFTCPPMTAFDPDTQVCAWRVGRNGCSSKPATNGWVGMIDNIISDMSKKEDTYKSASRKGTKTPDFQSYPEKKTIRKNMEDKDKKFKDPKIFGNINDVLVINKQGSELEGGKLVDFGQQRMSNFPNEISKLSPNVRGGNDKSKYRSYGLKAKQHLANDAQNDVNYKDYGDKPEMVLNLETPGGKKSKYDNLPGKDTFATVTLAAMQDRATTSSPVSASEDGGHTVNTQKIKSADTSVHTETKSVELSESPEPASLGDTYRFEVRDASFVMNDVMADSSKVNARAMSGINNVSMPTVEIGNSNGTKSMTADETEENNITVKTYASVDTHSNVLPKNASSAAAKNQVALNTTNININVTDGTEQDTKQSGDIIAIRNTTNSTESTRGLQGNLNTDINITATTNPDATKSVDDITNVNDTSSKNSKDSPREVQSSSSSDTPQTSYKSKAFKPAHLKLYLPSNSQNNKNSGTPQGTFNPVPQPYRAQVEPRSSKYSRLLGDSATGPALSAPVAPVGAREVYVKRSTSLIKPLGVAPEKIAALKEVLQYMTGKIVDSGSLARKEEPSKQRRWYELRSLVEKSLNTTVPEAPSAISLAPFNVSANESSLEQGSNEISVTMTSSMETKITSQDSMNMGTNDTMTTTQSTIVLVQRESDINVDLLKNSISVTDRNKDTLAQVEVPGVMNQDTLAQVNAPEVMNQDTLAQVKDPSIMNQDTLAQVKAPEVMNQDTLAQPNAPTDTNQDPLTQANAPTLPTVVSGVSDDVDNYSNINIPIVYRASLHFDDQKNLSFMSAPYMVKGIARVFRCPEPNGHFAEPKDCSVYYHCAAGVAYRRDCLPGQVFLEEALSCVSASLAPPCVNIYKDSTEMDQEFANSVCEDPNGLYRDTFSCAHYFECTKGWPIRRKCMSGTVFDEARGRCTWSRFVPGCEGEIRDEADKVVTGPKDTFECLKDGYFRDEKDCNVYYLCAGGEPLRMTCDHGTGFDVKLNMCVWSYLVEGCINNDESGSAMVESEERGVKPETKLSDARDKWSSLEVDFVCPEENGVFPDLHDCSTYYTCIDSVAKRMRCSFGTGYDDGTSLCMDARQVPRCKESSTVKESNIKSTVIPKVPFTCPKNHGLYPDTGNCSRFIHCFNKTAYRHECMPGTAFSSEKGLCTWRHLVPECNKESESLLKTTPSLTLPSSEIKTLKNAVAQGSPWKYEPSVPYQTSLSDDEDEDASDQAGIQDFQCPSVLDGFYRDNLFCDLFHRCVLGTRFTFTCPTGTFFRIEGNLCDFWETVSDCTQDGIRLEALNSLPEVAPVPTPLPVQRPVPNEVEVDIVSIDADPTPCPASSGLFAHPRNCKQFLFCAHHVPLVLTCPESLLYNSQTLTCDFPKNVKCLRYDHYKK